MNEMTNVSAGGALVAPGGYDPFAAYGQEAASGGTFLKFDSGEWQQGANADEVKLGTRFLANMEELAIGWIRWFDKKPDERRLNLLVAGIRPERRDELGDTDQNLWEQDKEGRPQDPWRFTNELPLADPENGEQFVFSTSSKGGIGCIGTLCKAYAKERGARAGMVPVIELGRSSYMHKEYGKTYVPVLNIVDWVANEGVPVAVLNADDGGNEDEKPAAKAAGSKTRF